MNLLGIPPNNPKKSKKKSRQKKSRIFITLTDRDQLLLAKYCKSQNISKHVALKRIIHQYLQDNIDQSFENEPENQLGLFDPTQMNIFDVIR